MSASGYGEFGVHGGDWGAGVGTWLALKYSHRVTRLHLNYRPGSYAPFVNGDPTTGRAFLFQKGEGAATVGRLGAGPIVEALTRVRI